MPSMPSQQDILLSLPSVLMSSVLSMRHWLPTLTAGILRSMQRRLTVLAETRRILAASAADIMSRLLVYSQEPVDNFRIRFSTDSA